MKINYTMVCLDGEPPLKKTFSQILPNIDCIIAADGGANWLVDYGIAPDVLIGDFDGVRKNVLKRIPSTSVILDNDQYSTDLEKAFKWAISKKIQHVTMIAKKMIKTQISPVLNLMISDFIFAFSQK